MSDAAAAAEEEKTITLMANDGKEFQISEEAARVSQFCNDALGLDDDHEDEDEADNEHKEKIVDVPRVTGKCLGHVVRFMEHHCAKKMKDIELPMSGETFEEVRTYVCLAWLGLLCCVAHRRAVRNGVGFFCCVLLSLFLLCTYMKTCGWSVPSHSALFAV